MPTSAQLTRTVFAPYYAQRLTRAAADHGGALTPAQELTFIHTEQKRTVGTDDTYAYAPTGEETVIRLPADAAPATALRENRPLTSTPSAPTIASTNGRHQRYVLFGGIGLLSVFILAIALLIVGSRNRKTEPETAQLTPQSTVLTPIISPTIRPIITQTTATAVPTPLPDYLQHNRFNSSAHIPNTAPVSLEMGGTFLSVATASTDPLWSPVAQIEWWPGTHIRPVFALPADPLWRATLHPGDVITVRFRSGATHKYTIDAWHNVHRLQTELLSNRTPSILLIFVQQQSDQRDILLGTAIQHPNKP